MVLLEALLCLLRGSRNELAHYFPEKSPGTGVTLMHVMEYRSHVKGDGKLCVHRGPGLCLFQFLNTKLSWVISHGSADLQPSALTTVGLLTLGSQGFELSF